MGKTQVTYFQDPNDDQAQLKNLTLELQGQGNDKQLRILLEFDPEFKLENYAPSNTLASKKIIPNSYQTQVAIPPGIYSVRAIESNTKEPEQPQIIAFKAGDRDEAIRKLAEMLSQKKAG
jgi:hypothetical protein